MYKRFIVYQARPISIFWIYILDLLTLQILWWITVLFVGTISWISVSFSYLSLFSYAAITKNYSSQIANELFVLFYQVSSAKLIKLVPQVRNAQLLGVCTFLLVCYHFTLWVHISTKILCWQSWLYTVYSCLYMLVINYYFHLFAHVVFIKYLQNMMKELFSHLLFPPL